MAIIRLTLQNRVTTSLIILSVIFIAVFTVIQLNIQLANINRYNTYQAQLSGLIVKNTLEAAVKTTPAELLPRVMQSNLKNLAESGIIKEAAVFDAEGKVVTSTAGEAAGEKVTYRDTGKIEELNRIAKDDKWFIPEVDEQANRVDTYIALRQDPAAGVSYVARSSFSLGNIGDALLDIYKPVAITIAIVILVNILLGYILSTTVVGPIKMLNEVTKIIAEGDLSVRTRIRTNDEFEELGETFNYMTEELVKMKERAENANPLTKLPGNIVIHEQVTNRIRDDRKFTVIYCDLDNFKVFNDKYGIAKGDEAIKLAADVFSEAAGKKGNASDFLGHEGGDDFVLITTPDRAQGVADYIIEEFNKRIRDLYAKEDLEAGYIVAHSRDGVVRKFPIMTISLSGVSNEKREIASYGEVTNIAAEVKRRAKSLEKSCFILDQRAGNRPPTTVSS